MAKPTLAKRNNRKRKPRLYPFGLPHAEVVHFRMSREKWRRFLADLEQVKLRIEQITEIALKFNEYNVDLLNLYRGQQQIREQINPLNESRLQL